MVVAFAYGVTGNWKSALVHLSVAAICMISCVAELGLGIKGSFVAKGPRGSLAVEMSNKNTDNVKSFEPSKITTNKHGELTNGAYTLNQNDMLIHIDGKMTKKGQFLYSIDANKAKIPVANGYVGVTGKGELTFYINVYRTMTGYVNGCPGNPW